MEMFPIKALLLCHVKKYISIKPGAGKEKTLHWAYESEVSGLCPACEWALVDKILPFPYTPHSFPEVISSLKRSQKRIYACLAPAWVHSIVMQKNQGPDLHTLCFYH